MVSCRAARAVAGENAMRPPRGDADLPPGPARNLVDLFRRLLHRRPLTIGQIAAAAKLSSSHISEVLRGWKIPSPETAVAIARVLGASDEEAGKAHRLSGQARELRRYERTHRPVPADKPP